jgi:PAT family beta-lactamase induction signal transducer AmpG
VTRRFALLTILYIAQGMPFGFQVLALPIYLAEANVRLAAVGLASLLAAPWLLKALWAPIVERTGRRRPWLLTMQVLLLALCAAAAFSPPGEALPRLVLIIFLMNLVTATQDIAVDGVAVDILSADPRNLGKGNIAQVAGYKVGMMFSGGVVVALSGHVSWAGGFAMMGGVVAVALAVVLLWREPPPTPRAAETRAHVRSILRTLKETVRLPGQLAVIAIVATYKLGESISDPMWKQYVLRVGGHATQDVGLWLNVWGMVPSILGSVLGGVLASRTSATRAVAVFAALRMLSVLTYAILAAETITPLEPLVVASWAEELTGGALTTAMFAFMMSRVDARIGATHYTVLASLEVLGKAPGALLSGVLAEVVGFAGCFAIAAALSIAYLPLLAVSNRRS